MHALRNRNRFPSVPVEAMTVTIAMSVVAWTKPVQEAKQERRRSDRLRGLLYVQAVRTDEAISTLVTID